MIPSNLIRFGVLMQSMRSILIVSLTFILTGCMTMSGDDRRVETQNVTSEALVHINAFREKNGLKPVTSDYNLVSIASKQVVVMASKDVLSHEVDGDFVKRMNAAGFRDAEAAENVGAGHANVETAINSWIASPHHRNNMLLKSATRVAVVRADAPWSRYRNYWALEIASQPANGNTATTGFDVSSMPLLSRLFGD